MAIQSTQHINPMSGRLAFHSLSARAAGFVHAALHGELGGDRV